MKVFVTFFTLFSATTGLAASISDRSSGLYIREPFQPIEAPFNIEARAQGSTAVVDTDTSEDVDSFLSILAQTSPKVKQGPSSLAKRNDVNDLLTKILVLIDSGSLDFNELAREGFNLTNQFASSVDLDALAKEGLDWFAELVTSFPDIPGAAFIQSLLNIAKTLVAKVDFNALAQTFLVTVGGVVSSFDFNVAVKTGIEFLQRFFGTVSGAVKMMSRPAL
ncbi:hypothetical protein ACHAP8_012324 [Fusarium lateritium]